MTMTENIFVGLGAITGACTVADFLVALACRSEPFLLFLCFIIAIVCIAVSALCFHTGGIF